MKTLGNVLLAVSVGALCWWRFGTCSGGDWETVDGINYDYFRREDAGFVFGVSWPPGRDLGGRRVEMFASQSLAPQRWLLIGDYQFAFGADRDELIVSFDSLRDRGLDLSTSLFFRVHLFYDYDQDGLSDAMEQLVTHTDPAESRSIMPLMDDSLAYYLLDEDPFSPSVYRPEMTKFECAYYGDVTGRNCQIPASGDDEALLKVTISGRGNGTLLVDGLSIPTVTEDTLLVSQGLDPESFSTEPLTLRVAVPRGVRLPVYYSGTENLSISLDSDDFCFGELDDFVSGDRRTGWLVFPRVRTTNPCVHNYQYDTKTVRTDFGPDAYDVECTWASTSRRLSVSETGDGEVTISGRFPRRSRLPITYTLSHPLHLFGKSRHRQTCGFCPPLSVSEEAEEREEVDKYGDEYYDNWYSFDDESEYVEERWAPYEYISHSGCEECDGNYDVSFVCYCPCHDEEDRNPVPEVLEELREQEYEQLKAEKSSCHVLKLHTPLVPWKMSVDVPPNDGNHRCCACGEHGDNEVRFLFDNHELYLEDQDGDRVGHKGVRESCTVSVFAGSPTLDGEVYKLDVVRNGEFDSQECFKAIGVQFSSSPVDFSRLGVGQRMLISAGEDVDDGFFFKLRYAVGIFRGMVSVGFDGCEAPCTLYYRAASGDWEELLDSRRFSSQTMDIERWLRMVGCGIGDFTVPMRLVAWGPGSISLRFGVAGDGMHDETRADFCAIDPKIVFDINRDGRIDGADEELQRQGRVFRFWTNTDSDEGDITDNGSGDVPFGGDRTDAGDYVVNGRRDFIDFAPMLIDLSSFYGQSSLRWMHDSIYWRIRSIGMNVVWSKLAPEEASSFQRIDKGAVFGKGCREELLSARSEHMGDGPELDYVFLDHLRAHGNRAVALVEASGGASSVNLECWVASRDGDYQLFTKNVDVSISAVEDMMRMVNRRSDCFDGSGQPENVEEPSNRPDSECDGRQFVFIHGFNVNADESRGWGAEIFKRLWHSGLRSGFTVVDWSGDVSQFYLGVKDDTFAPNYYANVMNAFHSAEGVKISLDYVPGRKIILAHSLGNVVASSAIADYGLSCSRYYMLNAAVPIEAYDPQVENAEMVDPEWRNMPREYWAANWSGLFSGGDFRSSLSWRGRFRGVRNAVNCYSATEEVLANAEPGQLLLQGGAWKCQELAKGTTIWHDLSAITVGSMQVTSEGGWGINSHYSLQQFLWYTYQYGFTEYAGAHMNREMAIVNPPFTPFKVSRFDLHTLDRLELDDYYAPHIRGRLLGDAIPATSFAAGANNVGVFGNVRLDALPMRNGWPEGRSTGSGGVWKHSDLKNVAYYYNYSLFDRLVEEN